MFLTCWLIYGLHFATNIVREHYPAFALAERATLRVDPYLQLHPDLFAVEGRGAFINNNPGAALFAALPYLAVRPLVDAAVLGIDRLRGQHVPAKTFDDPRPNRREFFRRVQERGLGIRFGLAALAIHVLGVAPLSAASVVVMRRLLRTSGTAGPASTLLALLFGLGTPIFFRSAHLNHNLLVAHSTFFAFALLWTGDARPRGRRLLAAGGLAGYSVLCDYSGVVGATVLALWVTSRAPSRGEGLRALRSFALGAAGPLVLLWTYQAWAFGNPLLPAQAHMPATELSPRGWYGLSWPSLDLLAANLVDERFGLLPFAPILALAPLAPLVARHRLTADRDRLLVFGYSLALLVFTSANEYARLQWNTGFRMLVPVLPFLFLPAAEVLLSAPRAAAAALGTVAVVHSWCLAMAREGAVTSVLTILHEGPRLPWLVTLRRAGYLPTSHVTELISVLLLLLAAAGLLVLWWPRRGCFATTGSQEPGA